MSLYAIGDLHLHFQSEVKAADQRRDRLWRNHEDRLRRNCAGLITDDDTLVLVGDHSWGRKLAECEEDFAYIRAIPGRKILLRGNHDHFWDVKKTASLNERFQPELFFLQDNFAAYRDYDFAVRRDDKGGATDNVPAYRDYAIVGTKGFCFEGPFFIDRRGRILGWDEEKEEHAKALVERELTRLRTSFEQAKAAGYSKYIMFLHYPPTSVLEESSGFTDMAEEYGAEQVIYAHCHGEARFRDSLQGLYNGVYYRLVSGDYLRWTPARIL
ncbi:MAG: metallophosphoesterase [Mogibacterium sp.]|nr:metallophosphoesterase [Mogibacterium sp.]